MLWHGWSRYSSWGFYIPRSRHFRVCTLRGIDLVLVCQACQVEMRLLVSSGRPTNLRSLGIFPLWLTGTLIAVGMPVTVSHYTQIFVPSPKPTEPLCFLTGSLREPRIQPRALRGLGQVVGRGVDGRGTQSGGGGAGEGLRQSTALKRSPLVRT